MSTHFSTHYAVLSILQILDWLLYIKTFITGTSMTYVYKYNYVLGWISLYTNLRCLFLLSLISITYMTYNMWIKYSWYFFNMPIYPPRRMSFLIWTNMQNREQDIYSRHLSSWFLSLVCTNIFLWNLFCTCRAYVLVHTYLVIVTLWQKLTLLVYSHTI